MAVIDAKQLVEELGRHGSLPRRVPIYYDTYWSRLVGPAAVFPTSYKKRRGQQIGIHLPSFIQTEYLKEDEPVIRELLTQAGFDGNDDYTLGLFIVLHEGGHWVYYKRFGLEAILRAARERHAVLGAANAPYLYRQLEGERWADQYALTQLKVYYARRQEQERSWVKRLVSLLRLA